MTTEPVSPKAIEAYMAAVDWFVGLLHREEVTPAWAEPSCLAQYAVGGVSARAVHSVMWLEQVLRDTEPTGLRLVTVGEFLGPNRVGGENDDDPFSASLRAAAEKFALVGAPVVVAACTVSRDGMVGLLQESTARRAVPASGWPAVSCPCATTSGPGCSRSSSRRRRGRQRSGHGRPRPPGGLPGGLPPRLCRVGACQGRGHGCSAGFHPGGACPARGAPGALRAVPVRPGPCGGSS
jgi:hypothetical protein